MRLYLVHTLPPWRLPPGPPPWAVSPAWPGAGGSLFFLSQRTAPQGRSPGWDCRPQQMATGCRCSQQPDGIVRHFSYYFELEKTSHYTPANYKFIFTHSFQLEMSNFSCHFLPTGFLALVSDDIV